MNSKNKGRKSSHKDTDRRDKSRSQGKQQGKSKSKAKQSEREQYYWQPLALVPSEREEPPLLSTFRATLKQIDIAAMSEHAHKVFTYFFPRFESLDRMPAGTSNKGRILSINHELAIHYIGIRQRRFAGDETLPRGSYWAVESAAHPKYRFSDLALQPDNNQLIRELFSYVEPFQFVVPQLVDSTVDTEEIGQLGTLGLAEITRPCVLQIINPHAKGELPAALAINPDKITTIEYPLRISTVTIPDVLDLRMPSAAAWLVNFCAVREAEVVRALEINDPASPTIFFTRLLRFLLHQEAGGSLPLLQGIGAWLRSHSAAGLVFPSARCDSGVIVENGKVTSWWGFNYVDYRGSSPVEWKDHFGKTHAVPNMEDEVRFHYAHDRKLSGTWLVEGIARLQELSYTAGQMIFQEKRQKAQAKLRDGSIYVSDPLVALFGSVGVWYMNYFPAVGHFIAYLLSGVEICGDSGEFTYDGEAWFVRREAPDSNDQLLLCPRCERVLIIMNAKMSDIPSICPSCGLGDRQEHARWEPNESWPKTPFLD